MSDDGKNGDQEDVAASIASRFLERDATCSSLKISDPDNRDDTWAGIVLVGDMTSRKVTFADVHWIFKCAVREGMRARTPVDDVSEGASVAPHMFRDEDLLDALVKLSASGQDSKAMKVREEIMSRLHGIKGR